MSSSAPWQPGSRPAWVRSRNEIGDPAWIAFAEMPLLAEAQRREMCDIRVRHRSPRTSRTTLASSAPSERCVSGASQLVPECDAMHERGARELVECIALRARDFDASSVRA